MHYFRTTYALWMSLVLLLSFTATAQAEEKITVLPMGDVPWKEAIDITVLFDLDQPAADVWSKVESIQFDLDGHGVTHEITTQGSFSRPSTNQVKLVSTLRVKAGEHTLTVTLKMPGKNPILGSTTFNVMAGDESGGENYFFGAAPFLLWPTGAESSARTGQVALEGRFDFSIPGAEVTDVGFKIADQMYPATMWNGDYFNYTADLKDGTYTVQAYICDCYGHTYLSEPCKLTCSPSAVSRTQPKHAPQLTNPYAPGMNTVERLSGGIPLSRIAGRFHLQLDVLRPQRDNLAPGALDQPMGFTGVHWLSYDDALHSFDNAPAMVWRDNDFIWEYRFTAGDWQYHHIRLSGTVSADGALLSRLLLTDRIEGPAGYPIYSELSASLVDIPAAPDKAKPPGAKFAFAFDGEGWKQHLLDCTYEYSNLQDATQYLCFKRADWGGLRVFLALW